MSSFKPNQSADEVNACEKVSRGFLVACGDPPKVFDGIKESFDKIAFSVERVVTIALHLAVCFWWNHNGDATHRKTPNEAVCVVAFVGQHRIGRNVRREGFSLGDVMDLPFGQRDFQWISQCIHNDMDLRRQPASGATYGLVATIFF